MGIKVKATCSECLAVHVRKLEYGEEDICCPACGHAMKNFPEGELSEMDTVLKTQRMRSIISMACFAIAAGCFGFWASKDVVAQDDFVMTSGLPGLVAVLLLVSLIFGILGSTKRYIIEF